MNTITEIKIDQLNKKLLKNEVKLNEYNCKLSVGSISYQEHYEATNQLKKDIHSIQFKIAELNDDTIYLSKL